MIKAHTINHLVRGAVLVGQATLEVDQMMIILQQQKKPPGAPKGSRL
jgi:hypothetical protein